MTKEKMNKPFDHFEEAIAEHVGEFVCAGINDPSRQKRVAFRHLLSAPKPFAPSAVPDIGKLREFYTRVGSVLFYFDEKSADAARYLAPPSEWEGLRAGFVEWLDVFDEEDFAEMPLDLETCLVIGETPQSGNYILVAKAGEQCGHVFEFDHDGFEISHVADNIIEYSHKMLNLDADRLGNFASHLRFVEDDDEADTQWWIVEMHDHQGRVLRTPID